MKPFHKLPGLCDDTRMYTHYVQVKDGWANAVDGKSCVRFPVNEVFGGDVVTNSDELYFDVTAWKSQKFDKAFAFNRNGNEFRAFDIRGKFLGLVNALSLEEFTKKGDRFPDVIKVFPDSDASPVAVEKIAFDPERLAKTCSVFNCQPISFRYTFYGTERPIVITTGESKGIAVVMPCYLKD